MIDDGKQINSTSTARIMYLLCIVFLRSEKYYLILPSSQADTFSRVVERAAAAVSMSRDWGVQPRPRWTGESVPRIDSSGVAARPRPQCGSQ